LDIGTSTILQGRIAVPRSSQAMRKSIFILAIAAHVIASPSEGALSLLPK
jgi:hypothetical protein